MLGAPHRGLPDDIVNMVLKSAGQVGLLLCRSDVRECWERERHHAELELKCCSFSYALHAGSGTAHRAPWIITGTC